MDINVDGSSNNTNLQLNTNSFWKNSGRIVPGRPSPKRVNSISNSGGNGKPMVSTFRDYQQSVSDAWDTGDDEFCIISGGAAAATGTSNSGKKP